MPKNIKWLYAAHDAKVKIKQLRKRIRALEKAIIVFQEMDEKGVTWPEDPTVERKELNDRT